MSLGVVYFFITRFYVPLTPGSYNLHLGSECFKSKLETNLIVALAGAAVANCVCALFFCYIGKTLCGTGTSVRCAEKILFILGTCFKARPNIVFDIILFKVEYIEL